MPVGRAILELPAGMMDDEEGDFVGTAAREVCSSASTLCTCHAERKVNTCRKLISSIQNLFTNMPVWQVEEETGIKLNAAHLTNLTAFLHESTGRKMFPSPVTTPPSLPSHQCQGTLET